MTRAPTTRARSIGFASAAFALAVAASCSPTPNILPTNDLNRPTDIAFMCLGAYGTPGMDGPDGGPSENGPFNITGRPMSVCHPQPTLPPPGMPPSAKAAAPAASIHNRTFAFVPNSGSGDLSVIDADSWKLVDLDKATGGYGRAPLGTQPAQVSATTDGCRLVTTNRGSCDLSLVNPSTLLASKFASQYNGGTVSVTQPPGNGIQRISPVTSAGTPLGAAPYEAVFLPNSTTGMGDDMTNPGANPCAGDGQQPATPWRALVTFPACNLIALVDLPSGNIIDSVRARKATTPDKLPTLTFDNAGTAPTCEAACGGGRAATATDLDAGVGTDGGVAPDDLQPTSIAITPSGKHVYVSFANYPAIGSLALSPTSLQSPTSIDPNAFDGIPLHDGALGSNRIRLGVDPYGVSPETPDRPGAFVGNETDPGPPKKTFARKYLYAIARDGSLRIIDVVITGQEQECETNFDPLNNRNSSVSLDADNRCIPYGSVNRRQYSATATSGLRFPTAPVDVAAAYIWKDTVDEDTVNGGYAWVLTANGQIFLVNIDPRQRAIKAAVHQDQNTKGVLFDPDPASRAMYETNGFVYQDTGTLTKEPPPFPNRPRDRGFNSYQTALDPTLGLPRLDVPPISLATEPYVEGLWTQGTEDDATALDANTRQTYFFYPDREGVNAQGWDLTWQGTIISPRYSGVFDANDSTLLRDGGGSFCSSGVLRGDVVTLTGCTDDTQCPAGMVCSRDPTLDQVPGGFTVTGICVAANLRNDVPMCNALSSTLRRYEITEATEGTLRLTPHIDEIVRSSLSPCGKGVVSSTATTGTAGTGGTGGMGGIGGMGGTGGMGGATGTGGTGGTGGAGGMAGTGAPGGTGGGGTGGMCPTTDGGTNDGSADGGTGPQQTPDDDCHDLSDTTTLDFSCVDHAGLGPRCLNLCGKDEDCRHGRVCLKTMLTCSGTDISSCPVGTTDCIQGRCFTRQECSQSLDCIPDPMHHQDHSHACLDQNGAPVTAPNKGLCAFLPGLCADGPELKSGTLDARTCLPQLVSYQVSANASYWVTGSVSGSLAAGVQVTKTLSNGDTVTYCAPDGNRDRRLVSRIPLRPVQPAPTPEVSPIGAECGPDVFKNYATGGSFNQTIDPNADGYFFDRFDPRLQPLVTPDSGAVRIRTKDKDSSDPVPVTQEAPQLLAWMKNWTQQVDAPNACIYLGGPIIGDPQSGPDPTKTQPDPRLRAPDPNACPPYPGRPQHVRARFRNTQVAFTLANLDRAPPSASIIHLDVHGGFRQESVVFPATVQISAPARLVLGPVDSNPASNVMVSQPAPFFFVVDQRRLGTGQGGGPTRGQIVRVSPFGFATTVGFLPVYEDYQRSGGLFPIQ